MGLQQRQTGSGVIVKINGNTVGFATAINYTRTMGIKPIYGIDSPFIRELAVAGPYQVTGSMTGFRLRDSGGLDGGSIMNAASVNDYFHQKFCSLEIVDRLSGASIVTIQQCLFVSDSWTMDARAPLAFNAQFIGVFMLNEVSDQKQS